MDGRDALLVLYGESKQVLCVYIYICVLIRVSIFVYGGFKKWGITIKCMAYNDKTSIFSETFIHPCDKCLLYL